MMQLNYNQNLSETALIHRLAAYVPFTEYSPSLLIQGKVVRLVGLTLEVIGCLAPIGQHCLIQMPDQAPIEAEVVGFSADKTFLMPIRGWFGIKPGARVIPIDTDHSVPIGNGLLGRIIDGYGLPIDGKGPLKVDGYTSLYHTPTNPLARRVITQPLDVGVRSINSLLTVGQGQRIGLFSGSGVGKSALLGMMTKFTDADVTVVGLIGERGREVKEFIDTILGEAGMKRSVVVASPADDPPLLRIHGAMIATSIAEYFRDQGKNVLLLLDSLTRYAQAQREIALAMGEAPATRGYPSSVFARIPQLVERAGNGAEGQGSITAFYTVLMEGDDHQEPIVDAARAILDGHIVLSRQLAESSIYPAIDIEASVSRVMPQLVSEDWLIKSQKFKQLYSAYEQNKDLINVGAYHRGANAKIDLAVSKRPAIENFLSQSLHSCVNLSESVEALNTLMSV